MSGDRMADYVGRSCGIGLRPQRGLAAGIGWVRVAGTGLRVLFHDRWSDPVPRREHRGGQSATSATDSDNLKTSDNLNAGKNPDGREDLNEDENLNVVKLVHVSPFTR